MKKLIVVGALCLLPALPGCELLTKVIPLESNTQAVVDEKQTAVSALQLKLTQAEATQTPDLPQVRADLQVAQTELQAAKAVAVKERVNKGLGYVEVGAKLITSPLQILMPAAGPALTALIGLIGLAKGAIAPKEK